MTKEQEKKFLDEAETLAAGKADFHAFGNHFFRRALR